MAGNEVFSMLADAPGRAREYIDSLRGDGPGLRRACVGLIALYDQAGRRLAIVLENHIARRNVPGEYERQIELSNLARAEISALTRVRVDLRGAMIVLLCHLDEAAASLPPNWRR